MFMLTGITHKCVGCQKANCSSALVSFKPRRSNRPSKKPFNYGQTETLATDEDNDGELLASPKKKFASEGNYQPVQTAPDDSTQTHKDIQTDAQASTDHN